VVQRGACANAFALRRANLLSILAGERVFRAKPLFPSLGAKQTVPQNPIPDSDADHIRERNEWFFRGRLVRGKPSPELRRRAYQNKVRMRARPNTALGAPHSTGLTGLSSGSWTPLGPMPLASDATGNGTQDYRQVSGRATAIAVDPADTSGNTIYIGGAQSGVWKSTDAANNTANDVAWTAVTDDQATLSIGAIAVQPGNADLTKTVILAATGTQPVTHQITVTGTSPGTAADAGHGTVVNLIVQ
jgi:hypothetical protein